MDTQNPKSTERYYFWNWSRAYGWQRLGKTDGYKSIEELRQDDWIKDQLENTPMDCRVTKASTYWAGIENSINALK